MKPLFIQLVCSIVLVFFTIGCWRTTDDNRKGYLAPLHDPRPDSVSSAPAVPGLYAHPRHWIAIELLSNNDARLWHRENDYEKLRSKMLGEVRYSESGTSLTVIHSCGEYNFVKTDKGLYETKDRQLFKLTYAERLTPPVTSSQ